MVSAYWDTFPLDGSVLIRIMEQFTNLRKYFLKFLATRKGFNGKSGIAASERYIRIEKCHVMSHILLEFVSFLLKDPLFYKIFGLLDMRNHAEMSCISFCLQDSHATSSCLNVWRDWCEGNISVVFSCFWFEDWGDLTCFDN